MRHPFLAIVMRFALLMGVIAAPLALAGTRPISGPDDYEPDDDPMNARWIPLNNANIVHNLNLHNFDLPGDVDWSKFVAPPSLYVIAQTAALLSEADTFISVYRVMAAGEPIIDVLPSECLEKVIVLDDGTRLAPVVCNDDDDSGGPRSFVNFYSGAGGIFYMRVMSSPKAGQKDEPSGPLTTYSSEAAYYGVVPGTLEAFAYDQSTETPVTTAIVHLTPLNFIVTENTSGVYVFGALPDDIYNVTVEAPGYASQFKIQNVTGGGVFQLDFPLIRTDARHTADYTNAAYRISLGELLRLIQFYNTGGFHCDPATEDHYGAGYGGHGCAPHNSDYSPYDWKMELGELLRMIQFYNSGGYHVCDSGEDGFCAGP